jgi:hypothetical protein
VTYTAIKGSGGAKNVDGYEGEAATPGEAATTPGEAATTPGEAATTPGEAATTPGEAATTTPAVGGGEATSGSN